MSKYWTPTMNLTPDDFKPLKRFQTDISNAPKDKIILGQIKGTYRCVAVRWKEEDKAFHACGMAGDPVVEIIAWISLTKWADMQSCAWNRDAKSKG